MKILLENVCPFYFFNNFLFAFCGMGCLLLQFYLDKTGIPNFIFSSFKCSLPNFYWWYVLYLFFPLVLRSLQPFFILRLLQILSSLTELNYQ